MGGLPGGLWPVDDRLQPVEPLVDLTREKAPPADLLVVNRHHWSIENTLHWRHDTGFGEDISTIRGGHASQVAAGLSNTVFRLLQPFPIPTRAARQVFAKKQITRYRTRASGPSLNGPENLVPQSTLGPGIFV